MRNEVKRYGMCGFESGIVEMEDGSCVAWDDYEALLSEIEIAREIIMEMGTERERLREDAERYRWIREQGLPDAAIIEMDSYYDTVTFAKECRLDTAIDNAMQQS